MDRHTESMAAICKRLLGADATLREAPGTIDAAGWLEIRVSAERIGSGRTFSEAFTSASAEASRRWSERRRL
jgi:hypothetical protein